ncbi:hypothetical protein EDD17DRAFT_648257 [Pisolithus thermaeus]|nr:hypothetical protein EDD17DRAFT_648257 [Pisolithus thermaeus]
MRGSLLIASPSTLSDSCDSHLAGVGHALTGPIHGLQRCGANMVYNCVRPRFYGRDSERKRTSEDIDECQGKGKPRDLPGPSAGQRASTSVVHVLLRLSICRSGVYIPTYDHALLRRNSTNPRPMRGFVQTETTEFLGRVQSGLGILLECWKGGTTKSSPMP